MTGASDGDSLSLAQEFDLWKYATAHGADPSIQRLNYSAGMKYSIYSGGNGTQRTPALAAGTYDKMLDFENWVSQNGYGTIDLPDQNGVLFFDTNRNGVIDPVAGSRIHSETSYLDFHGRAAQYYSEDGWLSDDERDEDADGLSNGDEANNRMHLDWWNSTYPGEGAYYIEYSPTSPTDPDSDGDTVRDGADDQDHDDVPNFHEQSRSMVSNRVLDAKDAGLDNVSASPVRARVNPFNPCLPFIYSRTCPVAIRFDKPFAPFDSDKPNYFVWN